MYRNFLLFLLLFLIQTGFAFSQCIVSDGGDDGSANQLRDCVENQADSVVDVQVNVLLSMGEITISRDVQIIGAGDPGTGPTIDANFGSRVFTIPAGGHTVLISNLTIMDGLDNGLGGGVGIRNDGGDLTIEFCTISGNVANSGSNGGGILSIGALGSLTISNSIITGNLATGVGGGIYLDEHSAMITDTTINNNTASDAGGGIDNDNELTVNNSLITGNTTQLNGGGIDSVGTLTINNSTISGNDAEGIASFAGGINCQGTTIINESTISGNTATLAGGGILNNLSSTLTITNSTISGNDQTSAGGSGGGGIAQSLMGSTFINNSTITANTADAGGGGILSSGTVSIDGSIVANQTLGGDCAGAGTITSTGENIESAMSCGFMSAGDLQDTDPLLGPLANNGGPTDTHLLLPGSPAIDNAGTCGLIDDQRGEPREADACDTGSVEVQKATLTITKDTDPVGLFGFDFDSNIPDDVCTPMLATGAFILDDGDSINCTITEGDYNVTETIPSDNSLTISCETEPADGVTINNTLGTLDFTTLPADTAVDCTFTNLDDSVFALDVVLAGPGTGTVTGPVGVPGNGGIDCPGDCTESYNPGTNVTLAESANAGSEFQGWSGDCNASGQVVINGNRICVATFKLVGGGDVLNPGDPLEFIQDNVPEVNEGGQGTFIVTARNATDANLTNVEISIEDEIIVSREITSVRLEPSTAFLEPDIGNCVILENSVECDIATLANDVDIVIDFVAEDVPPGDVDIFLTGDADQIGGLVNAIALVIIRSDGDSGCTVAPPGSTNSPSMLLFLLIPAVVLTRKIFRMRR